MVSRGLLSRNCLFYTRYERAILGLVAALQKLDRSLEPRKLIGDLTENCSKMEIVSVQWSEDSCVVKCF